MTENDVSFLLLCVFHSYWEVHDAASLEVPVTNPMLIDSTSSLTSTSSNNNQQYKHPSFISSLVLGKGKITSSKCQDLSVKTGVHSIGLWGFAQILHRRVTDGWMRIHTYIHTDRQTDRQKLTLQVRSSTNITQVKEYLRKIKALTSAYIINVQVLRPVFLGHMQLFVFIIQAIVPTLQARHYVYIGIIFSWIHHDR